MDVKTRTRFHPRGSLDSVSDQSPASSFEQIEETGRLTGCTSDGCVWGPLEEKCPKAPRCDGDIFALMNRPERDDTLLREAGIALNRVLFPLLSGIERFGPIGVVDLADGVGRYYTTVSRQVAKLERL